MNEIIFPSINLKLNINPIMATVFGVNIYWYAFFIVTSMAIGILLCKKNDGMYGIKFDDILSLFLTAIPVSILCARLYYVIFKIDMFLQNPLMIFNIRDGGLAIYGGIIGAVIAIIIYCKIKKISVLDMIDFVVPYLALGQCIGRWGNFFNKEAHGGITDSFFRMGIVENGTYIEVHPTFLYESVCTLSIFILLKIMQKRRTYKGEVLYIYLATYSFIRALIEGLRTDSLMLFNFRVSQILSIILFIFSLTMLIFKFIKNKNEKQNKNNNTKLDANNSKEDTMNLNINNDVKINDEKRRNMLEEVEVLCHSSIRLNLNNKKIYIDPYCIEEITNDADIIFITHDHYDHFSIEDINKIKKENTTFVMPESICESAINNGIEDKKIIKVTPGKLYELEGLKIETVASYNINKKFHPKENLWIRIYNRSK